MAKKLIAAALVGNQQYYKSILTEILYHLKRNRCAYLAHRKRKLKSIELA